MQKATNWNIPFVDTIWKLKTDISHKFQNCFFTGIDGYFSCSVVVVVVVAVIAWCRLWRWLWTFFFHCLLSFVTHPNTHWKLNSFLAELFLIFESCSSREFLIWPFISTLYTYIQININFPVHISIWNWFHRVGEKSLTRMSHVNFRFGLAIAINSKINQNAKQKRNVI